MQTYRFEFKKQAERFIETRSPELRKRLLEAIFKLPYYGDVKKLKEEKDQYRLRVGSIRVVFKRQDDVLIIIVIKAGNRGDVYK